MRLIALLAWIPPALVLVPAVLGPASVHAETRGVYALTAEKERALKPKDAFKECDGCPEMVVVAAGLCPPRRLAGPRRLRPHRHCRTRRRQTWHGRTRLLLA